MPSFRGFTGSDTSRKALVVILSIAMTLSMVPTTALAEVAQAPGATQEENNAPVQGQGSPEETDGDSQKGQDETDHPGDDNQPAEGKANSGTPSERLEESGSDGGVTSVGQSQPGDDENLPASSQNNETPVPEQTVTELSAESAPITVTSSDGMDNEELLESYVQRQLDSALPQQISLRSRFFRAGDQLQGIDHTAYEELANEVAEIAAGRRESSVVTLSLAKLTSDLGPWTAADLGVSAIVEDNVITSEAIEAASARLMPNLEAVIGALLTDCPYEMYWYDKTARTSTSQLSFSASGSGSDWTLSCKSTSIDLSMRVCADYSATGVAGTTDVDTSLGQSVTTTVEKAQQIVSDNNGKPVAERLRAYSDAICGEVAYNSRAAEGGASYGNPWQLVWVFDGVKSTNVVCEGYSKAFKYLCDLTWSLDQDGPECLLATGTMTGGTGAGDHMWNVVRMDDGGSYLVDVTNCDEGTVGYPDGLFLAYGPDGSYGDGYVFHPNGHPITYAYDDDTKALFGEEALTISATAYQAPNGSKVAAEPAAAEGLVYDGTEQVGVASGEGYVLSGTSAATDAGDYTAIATLADGYVWADGTTGAKHLLWSIARKQVTVTADDKTKVVGESDPEFTAMVEGAEYSDIRFEIVRETGEQAAKYQILPLGDEIQGNYSILFVAGTLDIQIAKGMWGTCPWSIDGEGILTVLPGLGEDNTQSPWKEYAQSINEIVFVAQEGKKVCSSRFGTHYLFSDLTNVTSIDFSGFDMSQSIDMERMFNGCESLISLDLSNLDVSKVKDMFCIFYGCSSLKELDLSTWNVSSVVDIWDLFNGCSAVKRLDLSDWILGTKQPKFTGFLQSVEELSLRNWRFVDGSDGYMFSDLSVLRSIDLTGVDTSMLTSTCGMFCGCAALEEIDLGDFNTSNVTDMCAMFSGCKSLTTIDLSSFDTSLVTSMDYMFDNCSALESLDLSHFNTGNVITMAGMFKECSNLKSIGDIEFDTSKVSNLSYMFSGCKQIESLDVARWNTKSVDSMEGVFEDCENLQVLNLSQWDTSMAMSLKSLFEGCVQLKTIGDVSKWNISNVHDLSRMFYNCRLLEQLDLSEWNTSKVKNMELCFNDCVSLQSVGDLSSWNTSKVTYSNISGSTSRGMWAMFSGCSSLSEINIEHWRIVNPCWMFSGCKSLTEISFTDTQLSGYIYGMFDGCSSLTSLDLSCWNERDVGWCLDSVFRNCSSLKELDISSWRAMNLKSADHLFDGCTSLEKLTIGSDFLYTKKNALMPKSFASDGKWWSYSDQTWYGVGEILANRSSIADTYTCYENLRQIDLTAASVEIENDSYSYLGSSIEPALTVTLGAKELVEDTDYTVTYYSNRNAGSAMAKVEGIGTYYGTIYKSFKILKAPLRVCVRNLSIPYGSSIDVNDAIDYIGFLGNDSAASLGGSLEVECGYTQGCDTGVYPIVVSGLTSTNYDITYEAGILTVTTCPVELSWSNTQFTYDGESHVPAAMVIGALNDDVVSVTVEGAQTDAGDYIASAKSLSDSNYCLPDDTTCTFTIAKAQINPTVAIAGWQYGKAASEPSVTGNTGVGVVTYRYGRKGSPFSEYSSSVPTDAGVYVVEATIAETANYLGKAVTSEFAISKAASSVTSAPTANELTFTGKSQALVTTGVASGGTMYYSVDGGNTWSADVPEGIDAGDYSVLYKVVGDTNHEDSSGSAVSVSIARASNGMTVPESLKAGYGSSVDLSKVISDANGSVTYSISSASDGCSIDENTGVFTAGTSSGVCVVTITAAGDNNHDSATKTISLAILPSITEASISLQNPAEASVGYDSTEHTPAITVVYKGNELTSGDFDVRYLNNVNAGTATIVVTGKGGFAGTLTKSFEIAKAPSNLSASTKSTSMTATYSVSANQSLANSNINVSGSWSKAAYANVSADATAKRFSVNSSTGVVAIPAGTMPGAYPVKVSVTDAGDANHESATKVISYTVTISCPMSSVNVTPPAAKTYNGSAFSAAPTVKLGSTTLRAGADYNVTYTRGGKITTDFKSAGTVCATVTGKGYYSGTKTANFVINPAKVTSAVGAARTFNGAAQTSTFTVKAGGITVPASSFGISGYKNNANAGTATATITGTGNFTGSVTGSFKINPLPISSVSAANQTYTGKALTPGATVKAGSLAVPASGYSVSYKNNVNAGTATVTVTGKGNFTGSKSASFTISPAGITAVSIASPQAYTGKALTPAPTVKAGSLAVPADGFSVAYSNNTNPGTATVTVTGKGNYAGSKSATFKIAGSGASSKPSWQRLWGQGALDTAAAVVRAGSAFADGRGGTVLVATSDGYWDALAAAGLAGTLDAPVVITAPGSLSPQAAAEIRRLRPSRALVMGGSLAISDACLGQVRSLVPDTRRVFGQAATDTAVEIYRAGSGWGKTAVVATSGGYWDALSIAPYAWAKRAPIFLTGGDNRLGASALSAIRSGGFSRVVIVGGALAVSSDVERQLSGVKVERLWGQSALDTSAAIARWELSEGMSLQNMGVATADGYWDALAGAALCGKGNSVLVLVLGSDCRAFDAVYDRSKVRQGWVFGGEMAVSRAAWDHVTAR